MLDNFTFHFLRKLISCALVLIMISTNALAAPRKPVYSSSLNNNHEQTMTTLEQRLLRIERLLESQSLVELLDRLENIQIEMQRMQGELEVINNTIDDITKRQRDLYIDIDRRLVKIESGGGSSSVSTKQINSGYSTTVNTSSAGNHVNTTQTNTSQEEQKQYQQAFDLLRELDYEKSITSFSQFITNFPSGRYAHIAQYWVGEANYAQRKFEKAINAYQKLISKYPKSPKNAEALLKIGYSYFELRNIDKAKLNLKKLIKLFPGTTEASQAKNKLQKIKLNR